MTTITAPICLTCIHFDYAEQETMRCKAYPEGIPEAIVFSEADHTKPIAGDNGMQYENAQDGSQVPPQGFGVQ